MTLTKQQVNPIVLVPYFMSTYQGSSTEQISNAFAFLKEMSEQFYGPFLNTCEQILQKLSQNMTLCQSVSNFIKVFTKTMTDQNKIQEHGPKDFINKLQHMFDNSKILSVYKENIALSYIKAAVHFSINFDKISQKIVFLYKTKQCELAILLSRAYISCDQKFNHKAKIAYYKKILALQLKQLKNKIQLYRQCCQKKGQHPKKQCIDNIGQLLKNLHLSLAFVVFEKFQSFIYSCLKNQEILQVIRSLQYLRPQKQKIVLLRQIIQKIVQNVFRMRRMETIPQLLQALRQQISLQWNSYQCLLLENRSLIQSKEKQFISSQEEISVMRLLNAAFNSNILIKLDQNFNLPNIFILPLFNLRQRLFENEEQDFKEMFYLFEDACFDMKSQTLEVQFNKLLKSLLTNYEGVRSQLISILDEYLFNNDNFYKFLQQDKSQILMLMNLVAFQVSYFMTDYSMLQKIQKFLKSHEKILFNRQNQEIYFHSLLLLFNYQDDIFCQGSEIEIFQLISRNFVGERRKLILTNRFYEDETLNLISYLEQKILLFFHDAQYPSAGQKEKNFILQYLTQNFDEEALKIFIKIMKNSHVQDKFALQIFDRMLAFITSFTSQSNQRTISMGSNKKIYIFIEFLVAFFSIEAYKHLFQSTLSKVFLLFQILLKIPDRYNEQFFNLIHNFVQKIEYVPIHYLAWMANLFNAEKMEAEQGFAALVLVLRYLKSSQEVSRDLKPEIFVNCIAINLTQILANISSDLQIKKQTKVSYQGSNQNQKKFFTFGQRNIFCTKQLFAILTLHQLIYYHSKYLTVKTLKNIIQVISQKIIPSKSQQENQERRMGTYRPQRFSFTRGKYQLIFILLFKDRIQDVNQILLELQITKQIYDQIYLRENFYLLEYDTSIFIKEQLTILRNYLFKDKIQMMYANSSFICVFHKFYMIYCLKDKSNSDNNQFDYLQIQSSDSDQESLEPHSQFNSEFKQVISLIQRFPKPQEWNSINQTTQLKEFLHLLRQTSNSQDWIQNIFQKCFNQKQKQLIQDILSNLQNVNGKYRQIRKINRVITQ